MTAPTPAVSQAAEMLHDARRHLAERTRGVALLGSAGVHPFSSWTGVLNAHPRYEQLIREFGPVVKRQLVCALQVHVALARADRALAVYNAARSYLPVIAALAANAPYYEGKDTGLASVRPLDVIPGVTLATVNLMSLFGLHRRLRGAIVGHLAVFEMTSSIPNRRYGDALRRLGFDGEATLFFDEHVVADAVHENIAAFDLAGGLVRQDPGVCAHVLWGARALHYVDARWASHVMGCWLAERSSLLEGPCAAARPARSAEAAVA